MQICEMCWCLVDQTEDVLGEYERNGRQLNMKWIACDDCRARLEAGDKPRPDDSIKSWRERGPEFWNQKRKNQKEKEKKKLRKG